MALMQTIRRLAGLQGEHSGKSDVKHSHATRPAGPEAQNGNGAFSGSDTSGVMVELKDVMVTYQEGCNVLEGVNLVLCKDDVLCLLGPNGSGKSTLIRVIAGLIEPDAGEVVIRSQRIGLAFQLGALFTSMTVADNIREVLTRIPDLSDEDIEQRVEEALNIVELLDSKDKFPVELSGGMQKRLGIARALAIHPDIMLYDEPFAGLDPIVSQKLEKALLACNIRLHMATLMVSHELPMIKAMATRVVMLQDGRIVFNGTKNEFFTTQEPQVRQYIARSRLDLSES